MTDASPEDGARFRQVLRGYDKADVDGGAMDSLRLDDWERRLIREALSRTGGNIPEAAKP